MKKRKRIVSIRSNNKTGFIFVNFTFMSIDMNKKLTTTITHNLSFHTISRTTTNIGIGSGIASNVISGIVSRFAYCTASGIASDIDIRLTGVFSEIILSVRFMAIVAQYFVRSRINFNITT